jgi:hypothetical protein
MRLSGMPAFKSQLNNTQLWQVSELVAHANEIPDRGLLFDHKLVNHRAMTHCTEHLKS